MFFPKRKKKLKAKNNKNIFNARWRLKFSWKIRKYANNNNDVVAAAVVRDTKIPPTLEGEKTNKHFLTIVFSLERLKLDSGVYIVFAIIGARHGF